MVLETKRLLLREMDLDDYQALFLVFGDPETMRHYPHTFDGQHVKDWIARNMNRYQKDGFGLWAVCLKETGELIGDCGLTLQNIHGEILPEIGYHIRHDCQRKGYAGEAAKAVRDWAFRNTDYSALYSYCKYTNIPSIKTAESIGMHFVCEYPDETNGTTHVSSISREEWLNEITENHRTGNGEKMNRKALVVIDIQNDITKHYRDIIENINSAIDWAEKQGMIVIYIKHNNLSAGTRTFKPGTKGAELVPELKIVSDHIFVKTKSNALTSEEFAEFIRINDIREFYITGADATGCVKSTCFNMTKAGYDVHVISDCVTSYDLKKMPEMLAYYEKKGCEVKSLALFLGIKYQFRRLDNNNFTVHSLDDFVRHQTVTECWRKIDNDWKLVPNVYEENWSQEKCREIAEEVVHNISLDQTGFGAFDGERLIGFATVSHCIFGVTAKYVQLVCFQVSEEYRRQGIGRKLFSMVCEEARQLGADKLYISAHSSKESQAAYRALGCTPAEEVNEKLAAAEPFDVQMEYRLYSV